MDVLLVEDDPQLRALLKLVLEYRGHSVSDFGDAESALATCRERDFPLVLLDWILPGMDGLELCRHIRALPHGKDSVILMVTIRTEPGDLKLVLAAGADDYLAKPIDKELFNIRLSIAEERAEGRLRQRKLTTELSNKDALYRDLVETQVHLVSRFLPDTTLIFVNSALAEFYGRTPEQLSGQRWIDMVPPSLRAGPLAYLSSFTPNKPIQEREEFEYAIPSQDGTTRWVHWTTRAFFDDEGRVSHFQAVGMDTTRRKRAEEALIKAKEEAEQASRAKSEFLSRMSHELRTPLNSVLGFTQLLDGSKDSATIGEHRDSLRTMINAGWHLLKVIDDLLNLSSIESGSVKMQIKPIDFLECVEECIDLIWPLAGERSVVIYRALDALKGQQVMADDFRFRQVLINLLSNAVKYNRDRGSITLQAESRPGYVRLHVSDTGIGIAQDALASIFEPFSRLVQRPFDIQGAGIGLAVVKQLMELMGGAVGVESQLGRGSTFWIDLPAAETKITTATPAMRAPEARMADLAGQRFTLLYIEDNPFHIELVQAIVKDFPGLTLITAQTPTIGLELAHAHRPDLILIDICLPIMDGYEVLRKLQAAPRTSGIPIMATSAMAHPSEIEHGLRAGFRRFFTKPLRVVEFKQAIEELLRDDAKAVRDETT